MIAAATANMTRSLGDAVISLVLLMSRPQNDNADVIVSEGSLSV
jgi:hypothetical protein